MITDRIRALDDSTAVRLLATVAGPRLRAQASDTPPPADLREAFAEAFGDAPEGEAPTEGDLARAALLLAAEDDAISPSLEALLDRPAHHSFGVTETVLTIAAAVAILQTQVRIERTPAGKWKFLFDKKSASDGLLKALAQAVIKALSGNSTDPDTKPPPQLGE